MTNSTDTHILNPFTPMAFLAPDTAYQPTVGTYVIIGSFSILLWDILSHLHADWKLLTEFKVSWPTAVYFLSRLSTLAHGLVTVVFLTAPTNNCVTLGKVVCSIYHITLSSTTLLFFFRVRAIFNGNRYIVVTFSILWLSVVGGSLVAMFSLGGVNIGPTKYCTYIDYIPYVTAANVAIAVFDTAVFIAITWRLLISETYTRSNRNKFNFFGRHLPAFTRALLQEGQKYYMVVALINLFIVIMDVAPGVSVTLRTSFLMPNIVLGNIMTCRVFRHTKMYYENESVGGGSALVFRRTLDISASIHNKGEPQMTSVAQGQAFSTIV